MQEDAGSNLLHDWIARSALAAPDKTWVVSADDGRTVSYGQLRETVGRFATFLRQRGLGPNDRVALLANNSIEQLLCYFGVMANGATLCTIHVEMNRNQLDNIFERLKPKLILYQDGLQLDDLLAATSAPRLRIGRWDKPEPGTLFAELAHCAPGDPAQAAAARRRRRYPVHLGHQRAAQGRGAEFPRISPQYRSARRRLGHHGGRPALRFSPVQLELGADFGRADHRQPRRDPGSGRKILGQPFFPASARSRRDHRRRQSDDDQYPAQQRTARASRQSTEAALRHLELGAAVGRRVETVRTEIRSSRSAGLRRQRGELDRRHSRRTAPPRHRRQAFGLSRPRYRRRRRPALCRRAKSAMSSSAAGPIIRSAISATTAK